MFESFKESLATWQTKYSERAKLQHTYIVLALALLVGAGLIGLLNREMGQNILVVSILSAGVFLANAVVWSLLQSAILSRIATRKALGNRKK